MTLQLLDIVIFSHHGERRVLPLKRGSVNIVTGASKTGKSALVDLVDYCFGADECRVPEGPIRRSVAWFGVRLQLERGHAFVARRCPAQRAVSSEDCFVAIGDATEIPDAAALRKTTNTEGLVALLTSWSGIGDNINVPTSGQTRPPLSANVRHALALCFQPQDEIIRRQQLFHGASDNFVAQALKDTLPYFLGAVDDDHVRRREELRRLRDQLRTCERQLTELRALRGEGVSKAATLLSQVRDAGLSAQVVETWEDTISALRSAASAPIGMAEAEALPDGAEYFRLAEVRDRLLAEHGKINEQLSVARALSRDKNGFSREASEQRARLASIGIFENANPGTTCPLCSQNLANSAAVPTVDQISGALLDVSSRLEAVDRGTPQLERAIAEIAAHLERNRSALATNRAEMEAVRRASDRLQEIRDDAAKKAHILGRVSLYLESLPDLPDTRLLEEQAADLRARCSLLADELSDERVGERIDSIISILGTWMTEWARALDLEHSSYPLRLDLRKLTIVADTADGPVPMVRMGSGENWVGYHLIGHLALHKWFTERGRPVPRFLFLDQPSQVYFPPEKDVDGSIVGVSENDRLAVSRMFKFVVDVVASLSPGFQVIITEHADMNDDWYQGAVIERWRGGKRLVPDSWPGESPST